MNREIVKKVYAEIVDLYRGGEYREAIRAIDSFTEEHGFSSFLQITRLHCLQLVDDDLDGDESLEEMEEWYELVTVLDKESVYARLEYGHFLNAVMDRPQEALVQAEEAYELCLEYLEECKELADSCREQLNDE